MAPSTCGPPTCRHTRCRYATARSGSTWRRRAIDPFRIGLDFGATYRQAGWGQGLTILTCMMNLLPHLDVEVRPRALYQGLSAVADNTAGSPPRFAVRPLPTRGAEAKRYQIAYRLHRARSCSRKDEAVRLMIP